MQAFSEGLLNSAAMTVSLLWLQLKLGQKLSERRHAELRPES